MLPECCNWKLFTERMERSEIREFSASGRWVIYRPRCGQQEKRGRIKSWNKALIHVVYRCSGHWDCFEDYSARPTLPEDLEFMNDSDPTVLTKRAINR